MEIKVELTENDYKEFSKSYGLYRNWMIKSILLILIDIILCVLFEIGNSSILLVFIILGGILYFFIFQLPYLNVRRKFSIDFSNDFSLLSKKTYKPFATGIEIIEGSESRFIRYEGIKHIGKSGHYIYLILFDNSYYLLPDWCFLSYNELDHFLAIIGNGITIEKAEPVIRFKPYYFWGL